MKKKILHLLSSTVYSGAENVVCQIMDAFRGEIDMAYCSPNGPIKEILKEKKINYLPIKKVSISEIKKVLVVYKPDIIHAHDIRASIMAAHFSSEVPIISHIHCNFHEMSKLSLKSVLYRVYINRFSHIFTVSNSISAEYYFSAAMAQRSSVLYNVVNEQRLKERVLDDNQVDAFDFIFLGRFDYQKDPIRLIMIISKIIQKLPQAKFVLIGNGPLLEEARNLACELNIYNNIEFTGYLNNPFPFLKNSKVMLMTSRSEGTPMCVLEAMLFGVPIVSTGVDGIKEIIENGINGYYFNSDKELVEAACHLITNDTIRRNQSVQAYEKAKKINNVEHYKQKLFDVYIREFQANKCISGELV